MVGAAQLSAVFFRPIRYLSAVRGPRNIHNLVLTGFVGAGKSSVGRLAATRLRFRFVDTDALIEARAGKPISQIFAQDGEEGFRELERQTVAELRTYRRTVISTGGGLVLNPANTDSLREHALVVCLWSSAETIHERTRHSGHRPLLRGGNPLATIRKLLAEREVFYKRADVLINTELRSVREVTQQVLKAFHLALAEGV
jgi:shikimate kinase